MTNYKNFLKAQLFYMLPFFNCVLLYFIFVSEPREDLWTTLLKCAPIVCLMLYILLKFFKHRSIYNGSRRILLGLLCSCVGDALLNMNHFINGMAAFAIAQICYISAFGWRPLTLEIGISLYMAGALVVSCLMEQLDEALVYGVPIYTALLLTMCWRSLARGVHTKNILHILCAVGCVLFVVSDSLIGLNMFLVKVPHSRIWIMLTYYAAQFAITLSTANDYYFCVQKNIKATKTSIKTLTTPTKLLSNDAAAR